MPAKSKQQQKFFGVVKAMQSGDIPKKGEAGKVAKDMDKKEVDKYASTKHKGLPKKVKEMIDQEIKSLTEVNQKVFDIYAMLGKALTKATSIPKAYRADYGTSLINMSTRDERSFMKDYGMFSIDDFIEDMQYNMANESVNELKTGNKINKARAKAHFKQGENIAVIDKNTGDAIRITDLKQLDAFDSKTHHFAYITEAKMTPAKVQKAQKELVATIQLLKKNFPMYKAAKDSGDKKKLEKHRDIALKLTKKKKELELALDQALSGLYQDAELDLKEGKIKQVTKQMWDKMDDDARVNALLTAFKDPDDAENNAESEYDDLPDEAIANMVIYEAAPRMKKDPYVEKLRLLYKDIAQMDRQMKMADSSRYSHVRRDWDKALLHVAKLTNVLNRKGPTIPEGINEAIPKFKSLVKAFDYIQNKRGEGMDLEQTMRSTLADIQDLQRDMEQEAEPEGGPIADRYAREMESLKREYNRTKAEFEKVMDEIDEFDQNYL